LDEAMPRKPRENVEGGIYHVYARGNAGDPVYRDDSDRLAYLGRLGAVVGHRQWRCLAYCLMTNHLHLLLVTPTANLSAGMQDLQGNYAQAVNARHGRGGHVFQGRYGAVRMLSDGQICSAAAYIARNPVDAGLVADPVEWPWSSFRSVANGAMPRWLDAGRLLRFFGTEQGAAARMYEVLSTTYRV
jgi:REP element-mobilizing transposase RayT